VRRNFPNDCRPALRNLLAEGSWVRTVLTLLAEESASRENRRSRSTTNITPGERHGDHFVCDTVANLNRGFSSLVTFVHSQQEFSHSAESGFVVGKIAGRRDLLGAPCLIDHPTFTGCFAKVRPEKLDVGDILRVRMPMDVASQRRAISTRKMAPLLRDCEHYVCLTLKSAEMLDTERVNFQRHPSIERASLAGTRQEMQLFARQLAGTRPAVEKALSRCESSIRQKLRAVFGEQANQLPTSFAKLDSFSDWLDAVTSSELQSISGAKRFALLQPLTGVQPQFQRVFEKSRDRWTNRTIAPYDVPSKTTKPEVVSLPVKIRDVIIGRAFDHNWELLSFLLSTTVVCRAVLGRRRRPKSKRRNS
jgi:hypothetical protein